MASALLKALAEEADREEEVDLSQDLGAHAQCVFFFAMFHCWYIKSLKVH